MLLDKQNEFSDSQAVTASAISTNVIDTLANTTLTDLGEGEPIYLVIAATVAATAAGAATVTFTLESDSTADLATSPTVHFSTAVIGKAALTAGAPVAIVALPIDLYERFVGVRYTVATGPLTAGAFDAFLTKDVSKFRAYAKNYVGPNG